MVDESSKYEILIFILDYMTTFRRKRKDVKYLLHFLECGMNCSAFFVFQRIFMEFSEDFGEYSLKNGGTKNIFS